MNDDDPINVAYSNIIHGMDPEELEAIQQRAFGAEVDAVVRELNKFADDMSTHFDAYVVAAALSIVSGDYDRAVGGDDE